MRKNTLLSERGYLHNTMYIALRCLVLEKGKWLIIDKNTLGSGRANLHTLISMRMFLLKHLSVRMFVLT